MCDTFAALPPATPDDGILFGKNSDRPYDERQPVAQYPAAEHGPGARLRCTYIEIPQVARTHSVLLSKPDWMWGAEMGANEHGVVIGNEAVWTREPIADTGLLGMDLLRLGLERGASARAALDVITDLLAEFGQGGACAKNNPSFTYHNSFLIVDRVEAWVLETAGRFWVAERIQSGTRNISNGLTIRDRYDLSSRDLAARARDRGIHRGTGPVDFAATFDQGGAVPDPFSRQARGACLLDERRGDITPGAMAEILRDHDSGICMHGGIRTTASMISRLSREGDVHWLTGAPHPCESAFKPYTFSESTHAPAPASELAVY